jgi:hypothetical protein
MSHPTNVNIGIRNGSSPKEPSTNVGAIWTTKIRTNFCNDGAITKKQDVFQEINQQLLSSKHAFTLGQLMHLALNTICGF